MRCRAGLLAITITSLLCVWEVRRAAACGCFAPPDAATPIVQAGERILFARDNGVVTAHIQILYAGDARDFGWLLPLPAVPELQLGTDELFTQLQAATAPTYRLNTAFDDCFGGGGGGGGIGCGGDSAAEIPNGGLADAGAGTGGPLVVQSSIGPYDYAVLKAESDREMLDWLAANHYFVPAGTDSAVRPYIRPGSFFLALKLRSGKSTGDIQPVIVKYASDLAMIPIILTSVGATPDMGIQVWILGRGRAIPRNFAHTVLNDSRIDWVNAASNYGDLVVKATREAAGRHTFITEYAGPSNVMLNRLDPPGRFGNEPLLAASTSFDTFTTYLRDNGYATLTASGPRFPSALAAILAAYAPMPAHLVSLGIDPQDFYANLALWRSRYPAELLGWPATYQPVEMADEIFLRVVDPTRAAAALFTRYPTLTRLYTTLSPEDMTRDPVFSENMSLPAVSNVHTATLTYHCDGGNPGPSTPATLETEQGFVVPFPRGTATPPELAVPASSRVEALLEEGPAGAIADNTNAIASALAALPQVDAGGGGGCRVARRGGQGGLLLLALLAAWRFRVAQVAIRSAARGRAASRSR